MGPKKSDKKGGKAKAKGGADGEVLGEDPLQFLQNYTRFSKLIGVAPNPKVVAQLQSDENQPLTQASIVWYTFTVRVCSCMIQLTSSMGEYSYRDTRYLVPGTWYLVLSCFCVLFRTWDHFGREYKAFKYVYSTEMPGTSTRTWHWLVSVMLFRTWYQYEYPASGTLFT